ncbi:sugar phosphate isomerase/epimerase family protein [Gorillibacterium timonense]|uniref:sugar phosphate isomerase/epimerase family protein n=1 Tax=Gorillibacterium timonense TaxID=1689269 RepID=UPI00071DBF32|nr:sugar phosphate isomerase/epimerase [Gorillibacterium timonense]
MQISVFYNHVLEAARQTGLALEDVLSQVSRFGISQVELDSDQIKENPEGMAKLLNRHGLSASCVYGFFDFGNHRQEEEAARFIDDAASAGAGKVLVIPGFLQQTLAPPQRESALKNMAEAVRRMCDYAEQKGITVTMEDFDDIAAPFAQSDELLWFLSQAPKLGCTFDTGNFIYSGENEVEALDKLINRVVHVHCKDRSLEPNEGASKLALTGTLLYPSPVGSGCIQIRETLKRVRAHGYDGTLAIEHFDAPDQLSYMRQSAEWLLSAW